jgi:hypothetical protein
MSALADKIFEAADENAGLEAFHRNGWTDGLPVILPTEQRVEEMLFYAQGLAPELSLGAMGPSEGEATIAKLAVNAVMAGCLPEYFPVVIAATEALLDPAFAHSVMQETTHPLTPMIIVNGPIRHEISMAAGAGALGPGHRANASIGRALRLIMMNIGGGRPGAGDMSIFGSPAKFTMCLAEAEESSPFEPLSLARGFTADDSTVTLVPVEGPHLVVSLPNPERPIEAADTLLSAMAAVLASVGSPGTYNGQGNVVALFNPDHATVLAAAGFNRRSIQQALWQKACSAHGHLRRFVPSLVRQDEISDEGIYKLTPSPEDIIVAVAGAGGYYSIAMPTLGNAPGKGLAVTKAVRGPDFCQM